MPSSVQSRRFSRQPSHPLVTAGVCGGAAPRALAVAIVGAIACAIGAMATSAETWSHALSEGDAITLAMPQAQAATSVARAPERAPERVVASALSQSRLLPWPLETVWPTAVRYLRVDRGYAIVDRDPEAGF